MRELTDEQYREIGRGLGYEESNAVREGRAAYAASFPYAVAEALEEPTNRECDEAIALAPKVQGNRYECIEAAFANRLSRLTAKPDPAVEAVRRVVNNHFDTWNGSVEEKRAKTVLAIVAAVDEARKGAK